MRVNAKWIIVLVPGRLTEPRMANGTAICDLGRVHHAASRGESACGGSGRRGSHQRGHAGDRARVQSLRDRVRAAAAPAGAYGLCPHFLAVDGASLCRPSDRWHGHPAAATGSPVPLPIATLSSCWRKALAASARAWLAAAGMRLMPSSMCRSCWSLRERPRMTTASPPLWPVAAGDRLCEPPAVAIRRRHLLHLRSRARSGRHGPGPGGRRALGRGLSRRRGQGLPLLPRDHPA